MHLQMTTGLCDMSFVENHTFNSGTPWRKCLIYQCHTHVCPLQQTMGRMHQCVKHHQNSTWQSTGKVPLIGLPMPHLLPILLLYHSMSRIGTWHDADVNYTLGEVLLSVTIPPYCGNNTSPLTLQYFIHKEMKCRKWAWQKFPWALFTCFSANREIWF